jgi:tRNA(fMet)-specific endonuclease VapC
MRYLLDANAVIALLNDATSPIARRIRRYAPRDMAVSAVVIHELYYGAFKSQRVEKNVARVDALQFPVLEFDQEDARQAGGIRAHLASKGTPIGPYDVLIAGQAKARKLTLVTHNTTEFTRVPGLKVEDWKVASPSAASSRQKSQAKPRSRPSS